MPKLCARLADIISDFRQSQKCMKRFVFTYSNNFLIEFLIIHVGLNVLGCPAFYFNVYQFHVYVTDLILPQSQSDSLQKR